MWLMRNIWDFRMYEAEGAYMTSPNKNHGHQVSTGLPRQTTFNLCCHNLLLGELSTSCVTALEKDPWKLVPGFLPSPYGPFPLLALLCIFSL